MSNETKNILKKTNVLDKNELRSLQPAPEPEPEPNPLQDPNNFLYFDGNSDYV